MINSTSGFFGSSVGINLFKTMTGSKKDKIDFLADENEEGKEDEKYEIKTVENSLKFSNYFSEERKANLVKLFGIPIQDFDYIFANHITYTMNYQKQAYEYKINSYCMDANPIYSKIEKDIKVFKSILEKKSHKDMTNLSMYKSLNKDHNNMIKLIKNNKEKDKINDKDCRLKFIPFIDYEYFVHAYVYNGYNDRWDKCVLLKSGKKSCQIEPYFIYKQINQDEDQGEDKPPFYYACRLSKELFVDYFNFDKTINCIEINNVNNDFNYFVDFKDNIYISVYSAKIEHVNRLGIFYSLDEYGFVDMDEKGDVFLKFWLEYIELDRNLTPENQNIEDILQNQSKEEMKRHVNLTTEEILRAFKPPKLDDVNVQIEDEKPNGDNPTTEKQIHQNSPLLHGTQHEDAASTVHHSIDEEQLNPSQRTRELTINSEFHHEDDHTGNKVHPEDIHEEVHHNNEQGRDESIEHESDERDREESLSRKDRKLGGGSDHKDDEKDKAEDVYGKFPTVEKRNSDQHSSQQQSSHKIDQVDRDEGSDHEIEKSDHKMEESDHKMEGSDNKKEESDHKKEESDHKKEESDHKMEGSDHEIEKSDHESHHSDQKLEQKSEHESDRSEQKSKGDHQKDLNLHSSHSGDHISDRGDEHTSGADDTDEEKKGSKHSETKSQNHTVDKLNSSTTIQGLTDQTKFVIIRKNSNSLCNSNKKVDETLFVLKNSKDLVKLDEVERDQKSKKINTN